MVLFGALTLAAAAAGLGAGGCFAAAAGYGGPPTPHMVPERSLDGGGSSPSVPEVADAGAPDTGR